MSLIPSTRNFASWLQEILFHLTSILFPSFRSLFFYLYFCVFIYFGSISTTSSLAHNWSSLCIHEIHELPGPLYSSHLYTVDLIILVVSVTSICKWILRYLTPDQISSLNLRLLISICVYKTTPIVFSPKLVLFCQNARLNTRSHSWLFRLVPISSQLNTEYYWFYIQNISQICFLSSVFYFSSTTHCHNLLPGIL